MWYLSLYTERFRKGDSNGWEISTPHLGWKETAGSNVDASQKPRCSVFGSFTSTYPCRMINLEAYSRPDPQMPSRRSSSASTGNRDVSGRVYLQPVFSHHELSKAKHLGIPSTPSMAAGLTSYCWSIAELLSYRIAPPPWVAPKRRGRPRTRPWSTTSMPRRAVLRLRKGVLCSTPG
jgi:hypothetical protein